MKKLILTIAIFLALFSCAFAQLGVYAAGDGAGFRNSSGDFNTFVGDSAGYTNTTGLYNTFIGYRAGYSLSFASFTQSDNTIIGAEAMGGNPISVASTDNVIIGKMAGYNHYGTDAVIIGTQAGFYNENGADVVFIGEEAGFFNTEGDDNIFIGEDAGYNNTTASDNTFVGNQAGRSNIIGVRNTFLGNEAGWDNKADRNTFIGDSAGVDVGVGHHNTFVGQAAGSCTEHADYNTFIGSNAGWDNNRTDETNNANYNTYLGYGTGYTNREGQYNVLLGALTDFSSTAMGGNGSTNSYNIGIGYDALINGERVYSCVIGANARVSTDNSFVIGGTTSVTRMSVGIGTDSPDQDASLELAENDKGFLINRLSSSEKTLFASALAASDEGMMIYDSTAQLLTIWDGTQWTGAGIQNLDLTTNILSISDGNTVNLSAYLDNTDAQDLSLAGNTLTLTNDGTTVNLAGYLDNTDAQDLTLIGNTLAITNDGTSVDLTPYLDDTNTQLSEVEVDAYVNNNGYLTSFTEVDGDITNEIQDLQLVGNDLTITNNGTATAIDLSAYLDDTDTDTQLSEVEVDAYVNNNGYLTSFTEVDGDITNEIQDLQLIGNDLTITNNGTATTIDLSAYLDDTDTDTQLSEVEVDAYVSNNGFLTSFTEVDGSVTNEIQDLQLVGNALLITNNASATILDLTAYLDNTDTQLSEVEVDAMADNNGYLTSFTELDGDATNELQDISLSGTDLSITDGSTIDLSTIQDGTGTDEQSLSLNDTELSISNGNTIDLYAILEPLQTAIDDLIHTVDSLENVITDCCGGTKVYTDNANIDEAILYQNIPNPWGETTTINYYLPYTTNNARIEIRTAEGKIISTIDIAAKGDGHIIISAGAFAEGIYFYTLIANNKLVDTKRFVLAY